METFKKKGGFTLIELLIVIGIIAILMAATLIAVNPFRQFAMANNANRWSGVNTILNSVSQNLVDNAGTFTCAAGAIPAAATNMGSATGDYDICACIVPTYVAGMPYDPQTGSYTDCTTYNTGYTILRNATTGRVTIAAPDAQLGETISVTR